MTPDSRPTLIETESGSVVAVSVGDGWVRLEWYGPRRADLSPESARTLGYVLRSCAGMADPSSEPGA